MLINNYGEFVVQWNILKPLTSLLFWKKIIFDSFLIISLLLSIFIKNIFSSFSQEYVLSNFWSVHARSRTKNAAVPIVEERYIFMMNIPIILILIGETKLWILYTGPVNKYGKLSNFYLQIFKVLFTNKTQEQKNIFVEKENIAINYRIINHFIIKEIKSFEHIKLSTMPI